jgi:lipoprotein-releasing system permease protein
MFELSVACKYLLPRRRQLSASIISTISVLVIALVVWLIVVFFSVTDGLEKSWIQKLTALTAPVRLTPTDAYYNSYYYQVDSVSDAAGYSHKTIQEKKNASITDPYDPQSDEETPAFWPAPDRNAQGEVKDLVKLAYAAIEDVQGVAGIGAQDFELTGSQIRLAMQRDATLPYTVGATQSYLKYPTYLGNFEPENANLRQTILPLNFKDLNNLLSLMGTESDASQEDESQPHRSFFSSSVLQERLQNFFQHVHVSQLKTRTSGWIIPRALIPLDVTWKVCALFKGGVLLKLIVPIEANELTALKTSLEEDPNFNVVTGQINRQGKDLMLHIPGQDPFALTGRTMVILAAGAQFPAHIVENSLAKARRLEDINFEVRLSIQGTPIEGVTPYRGLEIAAADFKQDFSNEATSFPLWIHHVSRPDGEAQFVLPQDPQVGEGVLFPKGFREAGVLVGDRGFLTYFSPTASMLQEQHLPVYVAGFYDPGIIPIGGKFILANRSLISIIRAAHNSDDRMATNGINVRFKDFQQADQVKTQLLQAFKSKGIARYWNVETYREYEFTKEIMRELQSQKNIFMVISIVIILVACSNIISMLVILVNDKKAEIGILRSMGASSGSIAFIFGLAGAVIGILGSLIGIGAAILTVKNLHTIVSLVSRLQGYDLFNAAFYGESVPQELSLEALSFVVIATVLISLLAGIVPAVKACLVKPSAILRATG